MTTELVITVSPIQSQIKSGKQLTEFLMIWKTWPQSFEVEGSIHGLRYEDMLVTKDFNILTRYFQQLDIYEIIVGSTDDTKLKRDY